MKQGKRFFISYNSEVTLDPSIKGWTHLEDPEMREFWKDVKQFESAEVVFLLTGKTRTELVYTAARQVLTQTPNVKILKASVGDVVGQAPLSSARPIPQALLDIDPKDFEKLAEIVSVNPLHPAQDYNDGAIFYGTKIKGEDYIIPSGGEMFSLASCSQRGILLIQPRLSTSGFSHEGVLKFYTDATVVSPEEVFSGITDYVRRHIYVPVDETYDLVGVWIMGTYLFRAFRYFPYLHLNAEKGSGKTLLMELMAPISFNGVLLTQPIASTMLKLIEQNSASLFIDEAEGLSEKRGSGNSQLKSLLRTGFARSGVYYIGETMYRTFSPKCFAGIEQLDDVLADRTITIKMMRKTGIEKTELYRETPLMRKQQAELRDKLYVFGLQHGPKIAADYESETTLYDKLPHLSNRAYDVWLPLFKLVNAFPDGDVKMRVFGSLDILSQADARRRITRDAEENETGSLIGMLTEVLPQLRPVETKGGVDYYDPDGLHLALLRADLIPRTVQKKGLSRMLKRILEIDSVPRPYGNGTKRMYAVDAKKLEEYRKRYADASQS